MGHRVAITGIGAVSPNGIGREAFWEATKAGISGVRAIQSFDPADLLVRIAGEIPDFDEDAYIEPKYRPHVSRAVALARAAGGRVRSALAETVGLHQVQGPRNPLDDLGFRNFARLK